jgi:NAD(P)-dependent dehydrogenase (short-subunit alcohol dehydrogenase family)
LKPFSRLTNEDFTTDLNISLIGLVKTLQTFHPNLRKAQKASVVLFSTVAVQTGMSYHASVAAAKGALEGLSRSLAAEWASQSIRVNTIALSLTDTPLAERLLSSEERREASASRHPLKRIGSPEEVASTTMFMLSDASSWMTGQIINLDGGISSIKPL